MKTRIELEEDDMRKIIAEYFSVDKDKVMIDCKKRCVGYGIAEHAEAVPYCTIDLKS